MEEWIGELWHRFITRVADNSHPEHAVLLASVQRAAGLLFHAAGGAPGVRIVPAGLARVGGPRTRLQRLAGGGQRAAVARLDADTLALPPVVAVFDDAVLNRDLYLWLAALAAFHEPGPDWIAGNLAATQRVLAQCPGLAPRWQRLLAAHLAQRPAVHSLRGEAALAESAVQAALQGTAAEALPTTAMNLVAPVWLWLQAVPMAPATAARAAAGTDSAARPATPPTATSATRRRARHAKAGPGRAPLLLPSRAESLLTFSEHVPLDRAEDDQDDGNALAAADDMEQLTLSRDGPAPASRVKFDLDLPSASADDQPLGAGETLPEWDWKHRRLLPAHCSVSTLMAVPAVPFKPTTALRATARQMRRRLEVLRAAPRWQQACADGDALDLDAWVRHSGEVRGPATTDDPRVFKRLQRGERNLATLLLADLSLSTDAHVNNDQRVIDVIRDALFVFGEALQATGDAFAMLGFSSVRRQHVRMQHLKGFDEPWNGAVRARVGAIKPGYYTRMGAAMRLATRRLVQRSERQRLLLILTDGKPNDIDVYEGRWGIEDTRHAVLEARAAGLLPFCLSIDEEAHDYLPHLFGRQGWAHVQRPAELPRRLAAAYARLTR